MSTPTEPGPPYAGPPRTAQPAAQPYGHPAPYGYPPPYGYPASYGYPDPYGYPGPYGFAAYPFPQPGPRRPGQVITAAVLAFVQAGVVVLASVYLWFFASLADIALREVPGAATTTTDALATEGRVLAMLGLLSAVLLVVAGVVALGGRSRRGWVLLLVAHGLQVVLSGYWLVRLISLFDDAPDFSPGASFAAFALFFAAGPLVSLGLVLVGAGRRWFEDPAHT